MGTKDGSETSYREAVAERCVMQHRRELGWDRTAFHDVNGYVYLSSRTPRVLSFR